MNLVFNAEALRPPITGVGNYSFHLLEQFLKGRLVDDVHCFTGTGWVDGGTQLAASAALREQGAPNDPGLVNLAVSRLRKVIGEIPGAQRLYSHVMDKRFERNANSIPAAVYHETNYILKPYSGPCVTTVHDLSHIRHPQYHPAHVIEWLETHLSKTLERADCVITVSKVVRDELIEYFQVAEDKVCTIYEGVEESYRPRAESELSNTLSELGLSYKRYVLMVATLEPRKGTDVLLDAWCLLPEALRREFPLVLVGSTGWRNTALIDRLAHLVTQGTVHHLGYVPSDLLPTLYSGAVVFTYPSIYEGFGLPVLDAMSSGVPVICRAGTSMAEFSQGACLLCDTGEPEELANKLEIMLENEVEREEWAQKGIRRAANFSWERCAAETTEVYRKIS